MLGRKQEINLQLNQILDAALIALAFWVAHSIRYFGHGSLFEPMGRPQIETIDQFIWIVAITAPFTPILLEFQGFYSDPLQKSLWKSIRQLVKAMLWIGLIVGGCVIFFKWQVGSRFFVPLFVVLAGIFLLTKDAILRAQLRKRARSAGLRERVLVAGTPDATRKLLDSIPPDQRSLIEIVDTIDLSAEPVSELVDRMHRMAPERVLFATAHVHFDKIEKAIHACETEGVEAWLAADFIQTSIARPNFDVFGGRPMLVFRCTPEVSWALLCKGLFDFFGAALVILLSSPLWVVAFVGIKLSSPGPALFRQDRSGRNGMAFSMLKFRTMHTDAEARRAELEADNQMSGPVFKIDGDPRIFRFGAFLRKFSIDELPQLLNVLAGQMSLVGPRPLPVYEIEKIEDSAQRRRLSVKPGLTCLWQISGRNQITSFDDWVALDLKYIGNWSIWLDFEILLRTIPAVLFGSGAR